MEPIRSILFIPGSKPTWFEKIPTFGSDAIILDLEDSVPIHLKDEARENVSKAIPLLKKTGKGFMFGLIKDPMAFIFLI